MYDKHVIVPGSLANFEQGGRVAGYEIGVRLPYYRGQWISIVEDIAVTVDGAKAAREDVRFTVRGRTWTLDEMETATGERWEFGEIARVSVMHAGGLPAGEHEVTVAEQLRISYLPWVPTTTCTLRMTLC
ncbi:C-glycoside deglycosidase beta subunit domain-containing protein [Ramlibacter albus]|uniref:C-deglycosylation enzyme beta subunit n=1 Tax=Ramlibacter albus TaxID=2079448 RepID=A0A923S730_9BURK|nr:DUF6379 domain-containing protein [Ramlibacter albus]MBC5766747.1 hypothetical protein [Ramlibacter albus]